MAIRRVDAPLVNLLKEQGIIDDPNTVMSVTIRLDAWGPITATVEQYTKDGAIETLIRALQPVPTPPTEDAGEIPAWEVEFLRKQAEGESA